MNFEDILHQLGVPVADTSHHHARVGWVQFDCPFCSPRSMSFRMGYSIERGSINCWLCGRHRLWETLTALGVPKSKVRGLGNKLRRKVINVPRLAGTYKPPKGVRELAPAHKKYLKGRGMDPDELVRLWGLGGIWQHAKLNWRLFVPIVDQYGRDVSWTTRATGSKGLRWLSAKEEEEAVPAGQLVYGLHYVRHKVIIHEGPSDVWATGPGAVGVLGVATTNSQILKLAKYPTRVVCYDNSPDAQRRAKALAGALAVYPGKTYNVQLDTGDDPATADRNEIAQLRKHFLDD